MGNFKEKFKQQKRKIILKVLPSVLVVVIRILVFFAKLEFNVSQAVLDRLAKGESFILSFWHGELLFQFCLFKKYANDKKIWTLSSQHFDGDIAVAVVKKLGMNSLRGSTSKGGIRMLLGAIKKIESGEYIAITPDGPRGPYHSIADGIVILAQKTNAPIVVSRIFCDNAWELKSWDKFMIPKPFSTVRFVVGEPFFINEMELEEAKALIKNKMEQ